MSQLCRKMSHESIDEFIFFRMIGSNLLGSLTKPKIKNMQTLNTRLMAVALATVTTMFTNGYVHASFITKSPDIGNYWNPLSVPNGTYVYANSFVPQQNSTVVSLGTWLNTFSFDANTAVRFQVWGSVGNNAASGPDYANVLATTAAITGMNGPLSFYSGLTPGSLSLTAGDTYWFSATVVGSSGNGGYQVGGHTQNSGGITDNGTFWYSNDPNGQIFDGQRLTPEMAFEVELAAVPEPSTYIVGAMLLLPFGVQGLRHLRNRKLVA